MGEMKDRVKGATNETVGKTKRAIGDAWNRPDIEAEGDDQEAKGDMQTAKGKAKAAIKNTIDRV